MEIICNIIPIVIVAILILYPKETTEFVHSILGRLFAIMLILFYSSIDLFDLLAYEFFCFVLPCSKLLKSDRNLVNAGKFMRVIAAWSVHNNNIELTEKRSERGIWRRGLVGSWQSTKSIRIRTDKKNETLPNYRNPFYFY